MLKKLLIVFCCLPAFITGCSPSKQGFEIIFTASLNGNQDIYRAQSQNFKDIERLTFSPVDEEELLEVTTKGDRLVYYVPGPSQERIMKESLAPPANYPHTYVLDLKTKTSIEIGYPLGLNTPAIPEDWSIDGERILLSGGDTNKLYTVNVDGKNVQELNVPISKGAYPVEIKYSPDGKHIVYTENSNFSGEFHLVIYTPLIYDFVNRSATRLGDGSVDCYNTLWSSGGNQILLLCNLSTDGVTVIPQTRLYDIIFSDVAVTVKEVAKLPCVRPAWSPTQGQFVAYCKMNDNHRALYIFNSDGSIVKEIPIGSIENPVIIWEMVWSPEGKKILYSAGEHEEALNIYMINADGSNNHVITTQPANYKELSISSSNP